MSLREQAINYQQAGNLTTAKALYMQALQANPLDAISFNNLACILIAEENIAEAIAYLQHAIKLDNNYADPLHNLAILMYKRQDYPYAISLLKKALQINPNYAEAQYNLGRCFLQENRLDKAKLHFDKCLHINPKHLKALTKSAELASHDDPKLAIQKLSKITNIDKNNPIAIYKLALYYLKTKEFATANTHFTQLISLATDEKTIINSLCYALYCRLHLMAWDNLATDKATLCKLLEQSTTSVNSFCLQTLGIPLHLQHSNAIKQNVNVAAPSTLRKKNIYRLGYISPDFKHHPISFLLNKYFVWHDRQKFTLVAIMTNESCDNFTANVQKQVDEFIYVNPTASNAAAQLQQLKLDILIDLTGFAGEHHLALLNKRIAPLQLHWLGYIGTLGSTAIDYIIADNTIINPNDSRYFAEKIMYLPCAFTCNLPALYPKAYPQQFSLPNNCFIFCVFCQPYRLHPEFIEDCLTILAACPQSILWLYSNNKATTNAWQQLMYKYNLTNDRICFCSHTNTSDHWGLQLANLYLDTYPISGLTSTLMSLWCQTPVLTYMGKNPESRVSASVLHSLDLKEFCCTARQEFIDKAIFYYQNPHDLTNLPQLQTHNLKKSTVFDTKLFINQLERQLEKLINS